MIQVDMLLKSNNVPSISFIARHVEVVSFLLSKAMCKSCVNMVIGNFHAKNTVSFAVRMDKAPASVAVEVVRLCKDVNSLHNSPMEWRGGV